MNSVLEKAILTKGRKKNFLYFTGITVTVCCNKGLQIQMTVTRDENVMVFADSQSLFSRL